MYRPLLIGFACGAVLFVSAAVATVLPDLHASPHTSASKPATAAAAEGSDGIERLDLLQSVRAAKHPQVGAEAPDFIAKDEIGSTFQLSTHHDRPQLFGAFCTCKTCQETAQAWSALSRQYSTKFTTTALIAMPAGEKLYGFHDRLRLTFQLIPDPEHQLSAQFPGPGEGYAAMGCPRAWVIGKDGRYKYVMPMGSRPTATVMGNIRRALGLPVG